MLKKRAPPHVKFTVDDHNRVVSVVKLLVAIAQRTSQVCNKTAASTQRKSKKKNRRSSCKKGTIMKLTYDIIGPWLNGPFLLQVFHQVGLIFTQENILLQQAFAACLEKLYTIKVINYLSI